MRLRSFSAAACAPYSREYPSATLAANQYGPNVGAGFLLGHYIEDYDYLGDLGQVQGTHFDLNEQNARAVMADMYTRLTYLDTGVIPVPTQALAAIADYTGMPLDILPTSLTIFKTALTTILDG